jgi:hypothetical protein
MPIYDVWGWANPKLIYFATKVGEYGYEQIERPPKAEVHIDAVEAPNKRKAITIAAKRNK